jgi:hypothetical protein
MKWTDRIGCRLKLRDIHIAVADAGSMTRAAEELPLSYPFVPRRFRNWSTHLARWPWKDSTVVSGGKTDLNLVFHGD